MEEKVITNQERLEEEIHEHLGKMILSWVHKQPKSNKFLFAALGVIGALFVFTIFYGPKLLPWLKSVATWIQYLALLILVPLFKYFSSLGKDQMWNLYEHGYLLRLTHEGRILQQKIGFWKNYSGCTYDSKGVRLIPRMGLRGSVKLNCTTNRMTVYSICRERISIANALSLSTKVKVPERPRTKEQRRLERMEKWNKWTSESQEKESQKSQQPNIFQQFGQDTTP